MTSRAELRDQLVRLVDGRCVDPLEILLQDGETARQLRTRVRAQADEWARTMIEGDDATSVRAMMRVVAALFPGDAVFDPPADWWRTPMGRVMALRAGHPTAANVSYPVAGAMLGISRQGVHDLVTRGRLERHPDGGVTSASVRDRLRGAAGTR